MNRRVILMAAGAFVLILAIWFVALFTPARNKVSDAKERREEAENQAQQLDAAIRRLKDAQRNEPLRRAQLETLRTAIPDTPNLAQFILDANDAAARSGIDFISVAPTEPRAAAITPIATTTTVAGATTTTTAAPTGAVTTSTAISAQAPAEITIQMQLQGGYFQVLDFLNRLDRLPRLVVTDSINVSSDTAGRLTVGITARMFVRAVPAGFAGATPTTAAPGATTTTAAAGATTTTAGANP